MGQLTLADHASFSVSVSFSVVLKQRLVSCTVRLALMKQKPVPAAYAHTLTGQPTETWQPLEVHLQNVGNLAARLARSFDSSSWAKTAGLLHDIGKYSSAFQAMLHASQGENAHVEGAHAGRVDHSTAGAILAAERLGWEGRILAYVIAGHHAGLPDYYPAEESGAGALSQRLQKSDLLNGIPTDLFDVSTSFERPPEGADPAFWIRLIRLANSAETMVAPSFLETSKGGEWEE